MKTTKEIADTHDGVTTQTVIVAKEFSRVLRSWLGKETMDEVILRNINEPADSIVCHSHDFCDANFAMLEAFNNLGITANCDIEDSESPEWLASQNLWNAAWAMAQAAMFRP